ncbi:phosphonate ABC transporter, permease protein PhnE [Alkalicoccus halolimnae]|uniref:Phosphonate ABC transporter, permease protein PhnE n=1 Tax=Alkalicoccus halolimnae TaxID=1667239 RepID=A0A5C7F012_9BACI|nr:phosphonate ABC transporter, permease protein PhnE [Alkalicoccus halolimnae]TXF82286.1 phosphonate ABC transporter, permease protein PhnE [Alkalicoccus halolimnae]
MRQETHMPPRFKVPKLPALFLIGIFTFLFIMGIQHAQLSFERIINGIVNMFHFLGSAFPPNPERITSISAAMYETFQIALVGTVIGVILSLPVALLASHNTAPHPAIRWISRGAVSAMRTIPDLIWALIFVISVGLGPLAGILTIIVDTIGFCARFFSERIEEIEKGPSQALQSTGASQIGIVSGAVLPLGFPSFVGTSLFAFEKSIRSAVVLGLVGAGGIGVELSTAFTMRNFDEALMIIVLILVVVILFEQLSSSIRKKII